jgi:ATP-dependent RNA helicase DeaD
MVSFADMGLKKDLVQTLKSAGFIEALEVQERIIPLVLKNKNVVFTSKTGSGKTVAYLVGFIPRISLKLPVQLMVILPTRELAIQVGKEMRAICDPLGINVGVLYGGRDMVGDCKTLKKKNQVLVGTPGRLIQHINDKNFRVGDVKFLVFDESDHLFDQGFFDDCTYILSRVSRDAQLVLASATISRKVEDFMEEFMGDYTLTHVGDIIPKDIIQEKLSCPMKEKNKLLVSFLSEKNFRRCLVFCNTKMKSNDIADYLNQFDFSARSINSNLTQDERNNALNLFKEGKVDVLVATDVAARGLHIENVDIVVNFDMPSRDEFYVHRIGRTGRVGKRGFALSIVCPEDEERFLRIKDKFELVLQDEESQEKEVEKK